jgi:hypothetical protein
MLTASATAQMAVIKSIVGFANTVPFVTEGFEFFDVCRQWRIGVAPASVKQCSQAPTDGNTCGDSWHYPPLRAVNNDNRQWYEQIRHGRVSLLVGHSVGRADSTRGYSRCEEKSRAKNRQAAWEVHTACLCAGYLTTLQLSDRQKKKSQGLLQTPTQLEPIGKSVNR